MEFSLSWILALLLILVYFFKTIFYKGHRGCKIPGPNFIEVARNFHLFGTVEHHKLLLRWSRIYGDIFQYSILGKRFVVFNTPKTIKSAFSVHHRSQNPTVGAFYIYTGGGYGITGNSYKNWLEQRKLVVQNLKRFGFRGFEMSAMSLSEDVDKIIEKLAENCSNTHGKALNMHVCLQLPMMNMMWKITASSALTPKQIPLLLRYQTLFGKILNSQALVALGPLFSLVKWEPAILREYRSYASEFWDIQRQIIQKHMESKDETSQPRDYVDSYLNKMQDERSKGTSFEGTTGMQNLIATLMDLNVTGNGTVYHTLEYILLHFLVNQDLQNKVREEVEGLKGKRKERKITLEDLKSLPYTEACIMEMIREFTPSPILVKLNGKDGEVDGHFIPAGSFLITNLWGANHNEDIWEEPFELRPERFLDETSGQVVGTEKIMSFSAGGRKCLGYAFAKDMLLLLVARIIQRFQILPHPDHPIRSLEPQIGFFLQVPHFQMLMVDRFA